MDPEAEGVGLNPKQLVDDRLAIDCVAIGSEKDSRNFINQNGSWSE